MSEKKKKASDLAQRTLVNGISAILIAFFIFFAGIAALRWVFTAAVAAISATAIWEFDQLLKKKSLNPAVILSMVSAILYVFAVFLKTQSSYPSFLSHLPEVILGIAFFGCFVHFTFIRKSPLLNISTTFLGIVYIGVPLGLFVRVMYFFTFGGMEDLHLQGSWWIIYLIAVTKSADIGGYFIGSYFGKRKLAHRLSPNKTLEGALGGLFAATLMSLFIRYLGQEVGSVFGAFTLIQALWLGLLVGIFGQIGDLAESLLKRDARVKDSNSIPGVGGVLDMVDSPTSDSQCSTMFDGIERNICRY